MTKLFYLPGCQKWQLFFAPDFNPSCEGSGRDGESNQIAIHKPEKAATTFIESQIADNN